MVAKSYRLKLSRDGQEFEAEGDKAFVLDMLKKFGPGDTNVVAQVNKPLERRGSSGKVEAAQVRKGKAVSIREFVQQLDLTKHTDITLAFGYYLERFADTPEFTPADINNCYYEAKMESSNTSQMIIQNIRRGYMMLAKKADEGRKRYTVTQSGEKFIVGKLKGNS